VCLCDLCVFTVFARRGIIFVEVCVLVCVCVCVCVSRLHAATPSLLRGVCVRVCCLLRCVCESLTACVCRVCEPRYHVC